MPEPIRLAVDLDDLAGAFENSDPEMSYYLDRTTGEVAMVTDEIRRELEAIYEEVAGDEDPDDALVALAIAQRDVPAWMREALQEADVVERGYGTRIIAVPRQETHEAYSDMEAFIPTVANAHLRERLSDAIDGRGAFSRFRRLLEAHEEERELWYRFQKVRLQERIVAWLAEEGIAPLT